MLRLFVRWVVNAIALIMVAYLAAPYIQVASFGSALFAALVLGFVNTLVRPVLALLTLPITIFTLGLFYLVLNGLLFWMVGNVLQGFYVSGVWAGVFGGVLYGIVSWVLDAIVGALLPDK